MDRGVIGPGDCPAWLPENVHYLTICGSIAYGLDTEDSDYDVTGFCMPPKNIMFPHLAGAIVGFDDDRYPKFDIWSRHHVQDGDRRYDFTVYSLTRFFLLCAKGNPNIIDMIFTPQECVLYSSAIGDLVRENRHLFLSKRCWQTFGGYADRQFHKMRSQDRTGNRAKNIERFGFDIKSAYHVIRLLDEAQQMLETGTLDIQRNREELMAIRNGDLSLEQIEEAFARKEAVLERAHADSKLPSEPRWAEIKSLLVKCIEMQYPDKDCWWL